MKKAIRRLVRGSDGTMHVTFIDLATGLQVFDLTGYEILDPGQGNSDSLPQNDNSGDNKVEINPSSGGSSGGRDQKGSDRGPIPEKNVKSKNPAIQNYLSQPKPTAPVAPTTPPGQLQVDPTFDPNNELGGPPSQPVSDTDVNTEGQVGTVDQDGNQVDTKGNTYISDPNNPRNYSVFAPISKDFNPGLQEAVEDAAKASGLYTAAQENIEKGLAPGFTNAAARPEGLPTGLPGATNKVDASVGQGRPEGPASGLPGATSPSISHGYARPEGVATGMPGAQFTSTPVGMGRPTGIPSGMPAASSSTPVGMGRPEGIASGLPGARPSVARGVIDGVRPEGTPSGLPGARVTAAPREAVDSVFSGGFGLEGPTSNRFGLAQPSQLATTQRYAAAVQKATNPAFNAVRPEAPASGLPAAKSQGMVAPRAAVDAAISGPQQKAVRLDKMASVEKGVANYEAGLSARMADNPAPSAPSLSEQVGRGVGATSPLGFDESSMAPGGTYNPANAGQETLGLAKAANVQGVRPSGTPSGLPAAQPSTAKTTEAPALGKSAGLNSVYGSDPKSSAAKSMIAKARDVTTPEGTSFRANSVAAVNNPNKAKTTSYVDAAGYSQTDVTGNRGWRNNNPGNIEAGRFTKSQEGYIGTDGRFAVFDTYENGVKAQAALLGTKAYNGLTISQAVAKYAPPTENNTLAYTNAVAAALGLPSNTAMSSLTAEQRASMISAMHEVEGSTRPGRVSVSLTQKGINARDNYTGPGTGADTPSERGAAGRSGLSAGFGQGGSRGVASNIGRNDGAGPGRGSSMGGPSLGGSSSSRAGSSGANGGRSSSGGVGNSGPGGSAGKSASGGVSGASRSTAGKGGASPSARSGAVSGASRSTAGKTSGGYSSGNTSGTTSGHGLGIGRA